MSQFQFLASDRELPDLQNPYIELLSVNEATARNIEIPANLLQNLLIDRDRKIILSCAEEEHLDELEIKSSMYYSDEYARRYSDKKYFAEINFRYTQSRARDLIRYINDHLQTSGEVELWSIWLGDQQTPVIRSKQLQSLDASDLIFLNGFSNAECLLINR